MSEPAFAFNPFDGWGQAARGLRDRMIAELKAEQEAGTPLFTPHSAEFVGQLAALVTACEQMEKRLAGLRRHDPKAYSAFMRAMENS